MGKKSLFFKLNNIKVRNKLLLIYMLCILCPVLITDLVFADRITDSVKRENLAQFSSVMDIVRLNIEKELESTIYLSMLFYTDRNLNSTLGTKYVSRPDNYDVYKYFRDYIARIIPMYRQVDDICIYTDNKTIPYSGEYVFNRTDLDAYDWYKELMQNRDAILFRTGVDNNTRQLSLIRKLNYYRDSGYNAVLKIDLNFTNIINYLKIDYGGCEIFLVNPRDEIVLSSNDNYNKSNEFQKLEGVRQEKDELRSVIALNKYSTLKDWKIVGIYKQKQLLGMLKQSGNFVLLMALLNLVVATGVIFLISSSIIRRLAILAGHIRKHKLETLVCEEGADEIGEVIREYNIMTEKMLDMIKNEYERSIERKNMELERRQAVINALQSQINPHFLFNTLESIRMRSSIKNEQETAAIIKRLSKIFRRMLAWQEDLISVKEEISFVEDYLVIQQYRFGDKIDFVISVDPEAAEIRIPKMTIQPFVENACVHGIEGISSQGRVVIRVSLEGERLCCVVEDNGKGMDEEKLRSLQLHEKRNEGYGRNIGIENVYNRLLLLYGQNLAFSIGSMPGAGTAVTFSFPVWLAPDQLPDSGMA